LCSEIHKLIKLIWNKEELSHQWKESIVGPIHRKGDKTDCSNYRGITLLSTSYKMLSNILFTRLSPYSDEITGNHQCGFWRNRSATGQIFYIWQILEKKWEYKWHSTSAIYRFQDSLPFRQGVSIIQYTH
jgi:hypothetical protein